MKQNEAVYSATMSVLEDNDIQFEDGDNINTLITPDMRQDVIGIVMEGFKTGKVDFKDTPANKEKLANDTKLKEYVSGLVSNWYRKDLRLNGGEKYAAKNPGSRAGQGDDQLKAMRALSKQYKGVDEDRYATIETAIATRVEQIRAEKAKQVQVNIDVLPADLVKSLGLTTDED